jgi:integrase/recombinase XerD
VPELVQAEDEVERHDYKRQTYREPELHNQSRIRSLGPEPQKHHDLGQHKTYKVPQASPVVLVGHARVEIDVLYRLSPSGLSEEPVPRKKGGWKESVRSWAKWGRDTTRNCEANVAEQKRILDALPNLFRRCGIEPPSAPSKVTREMVRKVWAESPLAPTTTSTQMVALRAFMRWSGNRVAEEAQEWVHSKPEPTRRRWLLVDQLNGLYESARGRERVLLALEIFNGLRRIEVLRLCFRDVDFNNASLRVRGKGTFGGKYRTISLAPQAFVALKEASIGKRVDDWIYPWTKHTADRDILRAAERAKLGVRVSGHDLRRSLARISIRAGANPANVQKVPGHASIDQTLHYAGIDGDDMREALDVFGRALTAGTPPDTRHGFRPVPVLSAGPVA